jgi:dolichol-phosphate mannosyltransferase
MVAKDGCKRGIYSIISRFSNFLTGPYVFHADRSWWLAGVTGALAGAVWNYAISSIFTWRIR